MADGAVRPRGSGTRRLDLISSAAGPRGSRRGGPAKLLGALSLSPSTGDRPAEETHEERSGSPPVFPRCESSQQKLRLLHGQLTRASQN